MGIFRFKQFEVDDTGCGMKVGTDSVLLGSWTPRPGKLDTFKVLDIGTGCGLLAMMIAQRFSDAVITAVEIDDMAIDAAKININKSPWSGRIEILKGDIMQSGVVNDRYDLIISNPPFFSEDIHSPSRLRSLARHGSGFNLISLLAIAPGFLASDGQLAFVAPAARHGDIIYQSALAGLEPVATCDVSQRPSRPIVRRLYLMAKKGHSNQPPRVLSSIQLSNDDGSPSESYRSLTKDFYLNF